MSQSIHYPRITIEFCTKCKWTLRATWYQSELFQTFSSQVGEISLIPSTPGTFQITAYRNSEDEGTVVWDRVKDEGFPDSKVLKRRVRDLLWPEEGKNLGHVDRVKDGEDGLLKDEKEETKKDEMKGSCTNQEECVDCKDE